MTKNSELKRISYIDRLKVLGLCLVILAHVDLPVWLSQLRNFDVPLLVFVSAYLAKKTYTKGSIASYYKKRIMRLAVPAWIFTVFFWLVTSVILSPPHVADIIKSLLFQRDTNMLGMLWVIWVYLVCAFIIPVTDKLKFSKTGLSCSIVLLLVFQFLCKFENLSDNRILYCTLYTVIPYGFITYLGYNYDDMTKKMRQAIGFSGMTVFIVCAVWLYFANDELVLISSCKYPAQIYYLSYSIPWIFILFAVMPKFDKHACSAPIRFISKSSLWIYLWHMLILYAVKMIITNHSYWWLQYILILIISTAVVWVQNKVVDYIFEKTNQKWLKIFKG